MDMKSLDLSPLDIARWFINHIDRDAGDDITHLKLQKLLYYAQAWWLANRNEALFADDMQAWMHGPVVPSVWAQFKDYGWDFLPIQSGDPNIPDEIERFLSVVLDKYGTYSAKALEAKTHADLPWKKTRGDLPLEARSDQPMDKALIRDY